MNDHEIGKVAASVAALRPDWAAKSLDTFIRNHLADRTFRDVAIAFAYVAMTTTETPRLVLEAGPWWKATTVTEDGGSEGGHVHPAKVYGLREGDPREICVVCSLDRPTCTGRSKTSGHAFTSRASARNDRDSVEVQVHTLRTHLRRPSERCQCGRVDCADHHPRRGDTASPADDNPDAADHDPHDHD